MRRILTLFFQFNKLFYTSDYLPWIRRFARTSSTPRKQRSRRTYFPSLRRHRREICWIIDYPTFPDIATFTWTQTWNDNESDDGINNEINDDDKNNHEDLPINKFILSFSFSKTINTVWNNLFFYSFILYMLSIAQQFFLILNCFGD